MDYTARDVSGWILISVVVLLLLTWLVSIVDVFLNKRIERQFQKRMYDIKLKREERDKLGG